MGLDRDVRKLVVVDGGVRDPSVGSEPVALYNPDGTPFVPGDGGGAPASYQEQLDGPLAGPWTIEHGLGTETIMVYTEFRPTSEDPWDSSNYVYSIVDEDTISLGPFDTLDPGNNMKVTVLAIQSG